MTYSITDDTEAYFNFLKSVLLYYCIKQYIIVCTLLTSYVFVLCHVTFLVRLIVTLNS